MRVKKEEAEHALARAEFYRGLVLKTTDPVFWESHRVHEAEMALVAVVVLGHRRYEDALAAAQSARAKIA